MKLDKADYLFISLMGSFALIVTGLGMYHGVLLLGLIPITVLLRNSFNEVEQSEHSTEGRIK